MSVAPQAMEEALREPWHSLHRQREAASFGVWVFLASEVMFFGGALLIYTIYRSEFPGPFSAAARETNIWYGSVNTAVLLTSSLSIAIASDAAEAGLRRLTLWGLTITGALGIVFLVIKGFEYGEDISEHLIPGADFKLHEPAAQIFWALYWLLTGVHALHLTIGILIVATLTWQVWSRSRSPMSPAFEGVALYWHLVDIIWIFLYPLIYLPGHAI